MLKDGRKLDKDQEGPDDVPQEAFDDPPEDRIETLDQTVDYGYSGGFGAEPKVLAAHLPAFRASDPPQAVPSFMSPLPEGSIGTASMSSAELISLGLSEALPPFEMIEDLYEHAIHMLGVPFILTLIGTIYSSRSRRILFQFSTPAGTCKPSTLHLISGRLCVFNTQSGR